MIDNDSLCDDGIAVLSSIVISFLPIEPKNWEIIPLPFKIRGVRVFFVKRLREVCADFTRDSSKGNPVYVKYEMKSSGERV